MLRAYQAGYDEDWSALLKLKGGFVPFETLRAEYFRGMTALAHFLNNDEMLAKIEEASR